MGFQPGTTAAPGLTERDKCQILGEAPDINILTWLLTQATITTQPPAPPPHITLTQPPNIELSFPILPNHKYTTYTQTNPASPKPTSRQLPHYPTTGTYTENSHKEGAPRQTATNTHFPTNTPTHNNTNDEYETTTTKRAKLTASNNTLDKHQQDPWLHMLTDSQTSLHTIQQEFQSPSHTTSQHHKPLRNTNVDSFPHRAKTGQPTPSRCPHPSTTTVNTLLSPKKTKNTHTCDNPPHPIPWQPCTTLRNGHSQTVHTKMATQDKGPQLFTPPQTPPHT